MQRQDWTGVLPAITTPFSPDGSLDEASLAGHVTWLCASGCRGIVVLGSLGEGATLREEEKQRVMEVCVSAAAGLPIIAGISGLATAECVELAQAAKRAGCGGLMVLPPYVYRGDWRETEAHFSAVLSATQLSAMIYNNPIAYGTDLTAREIETLADRHPNVQAVKESSGDARRITALRATLGDRLALLAGLDDMIVEAVGVGVEGWVAGLVNALPRESVRLFELARDGRRDEAMRLYEWFLPLLRFDTVPKFVQLIKLVQSEVGKGSEVVRPPRLPLAGAERAAALAIIRARLEDRPAL